MFSLWSSLLILLPLSFCTFALTLDGFSFWHDPDGDTLRPAPGDILFVSMTTQTGDPTRVDVDLYNIDRGNKTAGLSNLDPIRDKEVGFEIPWVPPGNFWVRIFSSQSKTLLVQSPTFQIYGPNATQIAIPPPTIGLSTTETYMTVAMSQTETSHPISSSTIGQATPLNKSSSAPPNNTGIIVGATVGGVVLTTLTVILIYCLRRRKTFRTKAVAKVAPFTATRSGLDHESKSPSPLSSPLKVGAPSNAAWIAANRAEALRKERERLDREIAALEGTVRSLTRNASRAGTSGNGVDGSSVDQDLGGNPNVHVQLEDLHAQVRRLEMTFGLPPGYR